MAARHRAGGCDWPDRQDRPWYRHRNLHQPHSALPTGNRAAIHLAATEDGKSVVVFDQWADQRRKHARILASLGVAPERLDARASTLWQSFVGGIEKASKV
jgi:hypothetical protein